MYAFSMGFCITRPIFCEMCTKYSLSSEVCAVKFVKDSLLTFQMMYGVNCIKIISRRGG